VFYILYEQRQQVTNNNTLNVHMVSVEMVKQKRTIQVETI